MLFKKPLILVNFKTYRKGSGKEALNIAKLCDKVKRPLQMAVAVQAPDIYHISKTVKIPVFAQHIDVVEYGSHTGSILAEDVKANGAIGTLINHSEHRLRKDIIAKTVAKAKKVGLRTILCAKDAKEGVQLAKLKPDYIAVEPPELIGNPRISVCSARPALIQQCVEQIKGNILVGAGVKTGEDVKKALELGAKGVLLASGVMKSSNPKKELKELIRLL
jgi:triosephosphate isomerase (TIM)